MVRLWEENGSGELQYFRQVGLLSETASHLPQLVLVCCPVLHHIAICR